MDTSDYRIDVGNAAMRFGIPLSEFNRFNFGFGVRHIDLKTGTDPSPEVVQFVADEGDRFLNFELNASWSHDSRDTAIFPTEP